MVHIIDDDSMMRRLMRAIVERATFAAEEYESAEAFLDQSPTPSAGCIILDLNLPGIPGLDLFQRLRAQGNDIPVIIISAHADVPATVRSMRLGAIDVLEK